MEDLLQAGADLTARAAFAPLELTGTPLDFARKMGAKTFVQNEARKRLQTIENAITRFTPRGNQQKSPVNGYGDVVRQLRAVLSQESTEAGWQKKASQPTPGPAVSKNSGSSQAQGLSPAPVQAVSEELKEMRHKLERAEAVQQIVAAEEAELANAVARVDRSIDDLAKQIEDLEMQKLSLEACKQELKNDHGRRMEQLRSEGAFLSPQSIACLKQQIQPKEKKIFPREKSLHQVKMPWGKENKDMRLSALCAWRQWRARRPTLARSATTSCAGCARLKCDVARSAG